MAGWQLGDVGADLAEGDALFDAVDGVGEFLGLGFGHADEVVCEALGGFGSDAWEASECLDDACDGCGDAMRGVGRRCDGGYGTGRVGAKGGHGGDCNGG